VEEGAAGCNFVEGVSSLIFSGIIIGGAAGASPEPKETGFAVVRSTQNGSTHHI
jgi:hypothetical protein